MNKKSIIAIAILGIMLIAGIFYAVNDNNDNQAEGPVIEDNESKSEEAPESDKYESEDDKDIPKEETDSQVVEEDEQVEDTVDLEKGKPAPDFTLTNLEGKEASLSDYKGKIVLLNFWATWCTYCDEEMPDLEKLNNENEDLVVLAIDVGEEADLVREYIEEGGYTFPVLLDKNRSVSQREYYVSAFPTSYFIDKEGNLIGAVSGMMTYPQMNQILEDIKSGEI